jgi:hypothetical protein
MLSPQPLNVIPDAENRRSGIQRHDQRAALDSGLAPLARPGMTWRVLRLSQSFLLPSIPIEILRREPALERGLARRRDDVDQGELLDRLAVQRTVAPAAR